MTIQAKNEYDIQAEEALKKVGATFNSKFTGVKKHFPEDKTERITFKFTLTKGDKCYVGTFGGSLKDTEEYTAYNVIPKLRAYDVLSGLTYYAPGSFEDFCSEYGYDTDSIKAFKTYQAVKKEYEGLSALFTEDELNILSEVR